MKNIAIALIYVSFFAMIGASIYITKSLLPLFALIAMPTCEFNNEK